MIALVDRVFLVAGFCCCCCFSTLNISCYSLLACKVSAEKSTDSCMGLPLYVTVFFSLALFETVYHYFFAILITMCFVVDLLGLVLLGALCASKIWISFSFPRFGKFSAIISSDKFSAPFTLSSSGILIMQMLLYLMVLVSSLNLFSFFIILFFFLLFSLIEFHYSVLQKFP